MKLLAKKDARLYFKFIRGTNLDMDLGQVKTWLIQNGYIEHVEGDKHIIKKKMNRTEILEELKSENRN